MYIMKTSKIDRVFRVIILGDSLKDNYVEANGILKIAPTPRGVKKLRDMIELIYKTIYEEYDQFTIYDIIDCLNKQTRFGLVMQLKRALNTYNKYNMYSELNDKEREENDTSWMNEVINYIMTHKGKDEGEIDKC